MALNIKPLSDRVLIEPVAAETKTSGFIPDTAKEKPQKELLLQLGMAKRTHNDSEIGDSVLYGNIQVQLKLEGKDYLIMREEDILAIV
jgi:chaperonin GroES